MQKKHPIVFAGLMGALLAPDVAAAANTKILFNVFIPRRHPIHVGVVDAWAKRVNKATEGRVTITYPASSLAPPPRQWSMVQKSIADAAMLYNGMEVRRLKLRQMFHLPLIGGTAEASGIAMNRVTEKFFAKAKEFKGIKFLGHFGYPSGHLHMRAKKVTSVADLKNVKMRVGADAGLTMKLLGGVPVPTPGARGHEVISKGVVDGSVYSFGDIAAFKLFKYVKHTTIVPGGLSNAGFSILMNQKKWDGISAKDKAAITAVSFEAVGRSGRKMDELGDKAMNAMKKAGIDVTTASPAFLAEMEKKLAPLEQRWLDSVKGSGVDAKAALAFYKAEVKRLSGAK